MKIKKIKIIKFRNLYDINIHFSPQLNAIAGQNGTSKTALLGLISHIFTFSRKYKTITENRFTKKFSEIFRFAYPTYDKAGDHIWETEFDNGEIVSAVSYDRIEKEKKKNIRIRVGKSKRGSGKIKLPVVYLGMGRLFPLTLENNIKSNDSSLTEEEINQFKDLHNEILLINHDVTPESISCATKSFYAPHTKNYNYLGNSAGQDNLGQIITTLISFKRLQKELGDKYSGGILLIDEIDASLFPAAQMKLIEKLYLKSLELNLQIFFTTHSLEVLSETLKKDKSGIIYLDNSFGRIEPIYDLDIASLSRNLLVSGPIALESIKIKKHFYCEDNEAVDFLKNILPSDIRKKIEIFPAKLGSTTLKELAKKNLPDFKNSIIVLDGDSNPGRLKNIISLPGTKGPDALIYKALKELPDNHDFWKFNEGYNKQFCFRDLMSLESSTDPRRRREKLKNWYKTQKQHWGRLGKKAWDIWISQNQEETNIFIEKIKSLI